jgi:hypothetical protein
MSLTNRNKAENETYVMLIFLSSSSKAIRNMATVKLFYHLRSCHTRSVTSLVFDV